jgi:hypothetical protein
MSESTSPTVSPEALLVRTRFAYRRGSLRLLLTRIGVRGLLLLLAVFALFALWSAVQLWPYYTYPFRSGYGGPFLLHSIA